MAIATCCVDQTLIEHYTVPVQVNTVVSRKVHDLAGPFDIDLPLTGNLGIECRSGGPNGDYTLFFTFANALVNMANAPSAVDAAKSTTVRSGRIAIST
jgi:hypothetical protein